MQALAALQDMLYAQDRWAVLLIFQAMDAAGKDGAIKHVMSGVNPQGCQVFSFKSPSSGRARSRLPVALHEMSARARPDRHLQPQLLRGNARRARAPRVPRAAASADRAGATTASGSSASAEIRNFEEYLTGNGIAVCKFFLHLSRGEQRKRFLMRLDDKAKNWKFSINDAAGAEALDALHGGIRRHDPRTRPRKRRRGT